MTAYKSLLLGKSIALVGCGKMGSALLKGSLGAELHNDFIVIDPGELPGQFQNNPHIRHFRNAADAAEHLANSAMIVLAVKPQDMDAACASIAENISDDSLILSIAAGKSLSSFERHFGASHAIVRAMPNLPATIHRGITVAIKNPSVSENQFKLAGEFLRSAGEVRWTENEALMDAVTAVSGSGPAYVCLMEEILARSIWPQHPSDVIEDPAKAARETLTIGAEILKHSVDFSNLIENTKNHIPDEDKPLRPHRIYMYLLANALAKAGEKQGLPPELALDLATHTITGTVDLLESDPSTTAQKLREAVTSKGGTTEAALKILMREKTGMKDLLDAALNLYSSPSRALLVLQAGKGKIPSLDKLMAEAIAAATQRGRELNTVKKTEHSSVSPELT